MKARVIRVDTTADTQSGQVNMKMCMQIKDHQHLIALLNKIERIRNVFSVKRIDL